MHSARQTPSALQIFNPSRKEGGSMAQYEISNSGTQNVKAIKGQNVKKGKATVKTGTDLRTGKK